MEITKKSFSDGFSWVLSALKLCLPKAPAFILKSFLAALGFALIFFIIRHWTVKFLNYFFPVKTKCLLVF